MTTYHIDITDDTGKVLADAYGDLDVINYVSKRAVGFLDSSDTVTVKVVEVNAIRGDTEKRSVLTITADGETATVMLKRKITTERKASTPAETVSV